MEAQASSFETSEMLASFLTSTPLVSESWRLCNLANTTSPRAGFLVERLLSTSSGVSCLAFSGIHQSVFTLLDPSNDDLVKLNSDCTNGMFSRFGDDRNHRGEEHAPVMVHSGLLNLFLTLWNSTLRNQMPAILANSKSVIITGHSIGGAIASLTALWLLCYLQSISSHISVLCITFGSPLLGNESLSRAILCKRWGGNFLHVVSKQDIMPRLHLAQVAQSLTPHLRSLLQFWHFSMTPSSNFPSFVMQINPVVKNNLFRSAVSHLETMEKRSASSLFWPFGNYVFCSLEGAICLDNSAAIITMLHVLLVRGSASSSIEDHLNYGDYVDKVSLQFLSKRSFMEENKLSGSSYDAGIALALQSLGIASAQEIDARPIVECLKLARRMGRTPNLNSANQAISLSKITPYRAEIEWYKASCDKSSDQMGYYDSFKERSASKRDSKVNMNRLKLAGFWNSVIKMLDDNLLPHDFHKRAKWVNASQFYKLLVEPLDIAEYYHQNRIHGIKGHYMSNGRDRRYLIFDQWWTEKRVGEEENTKRSKFASLTQDSCFWARVEEAKEWLENARIESDAGMLAILWKKINEFEMYARKLVETKAVSIDVVAKNSSYSLWVEQFKGLQQVQQA